MPSGHFPTSSNDLTEIYSRKCSQYNQCHRAMEHLATAKCPHGSHLLLHFPYPRQESHSSTCSGPLCHDLPVLPLLMSAVCSFSGLSITPEHRSHLELMAPASWNFLSQSGIPGQLLCDSVSKKTVPLHFSDFAVWPWCHSSCCYPPYFVSMPAGTAAISQLLWSMSPLANGANEVCFLYLLVICICSLLKHLLNPFGSFWMFPLDCRSSLHIWPISVTSSLLCQNVQQKNILRGRIYHSLL